MSKATWIIAPALLLAAAPARAERCVDASSNVEIGACLAEVGLDVERELLLTLAAAQRNIAGRDFMEPTTLARFAAAFDRAQATWLAWREADCGEVTGFEWWGGSGAGIAARSCRIEATVARVRDLTARYDLPPTDTPVSHDAEG
jgi:uncharacterized protein YecT (DUF1311 family)